MTILYTSFHILDLDNDTVQRKEMPEEFQGFVKDILSMRIQMRKIKCIPFMMNKHKLFRVFVKWH